MRKLLIIFVAAAATTATTAVAQNTSDRRADSIAVIAVAEGLLKGISTRDTALIRKLMLPGSQLASIADPASAASASRLESDSTFIVRLGSTKQRYLERMWNPTVFLQGSLAIVRAPYDFHIDGVFSHCGVDTFTMVRSKGEWRATHIAYTTQRQGCAPSPLGAPDR